MDRTLRYVPAFRCIGGDCEDDCCHGWQVILDERTYTDLVAARPDVLGDGRGTRALVDREAPETASAERFASIRLAEDGRCPFQDPAGLCVIHAELGEDHLGPVCATYPRQLARRNGRLELSLALSCPEAVRLCLAGDDAVDPVELPPDLVANPKYIVRPERPRAAAATWADAADTIDEVVRQLLALRSYPLASRLFFAASFADRITPFLHAGATGIARDRFADELTRLAVPGQLDTWHAQLRAMDVPLEPPMQVILMILIGRDDPRTPLGRSLADIWRAVGWGDRALLQDRAARGELDLAPAVARYRAGRDRLEPLCADLHDRHLTNYALNFLFREDLAAAPSLVTHLECLLIRRAIVRFLIFSDPRWDDPPAGSADLAAAFTATTVEAIYRAARALEHDPELADLISATLAEQGRQSLAHLVLLLRI